MDDPTISCVRLDSGNPALGGGSTWPPQSIRICLYLQNPGRITLLEETALESAKAFHFLHQTRRAAIRPQNPVSGGFATDDPGQRCNRKRKRRLVEEYVKTRKNGT